MKRLAVVLALGLASCGCYSIGKDIDKAKAVQIKPGMTRVQLITLVGYPDHLSRDGSGNTEYSYHYVHAKIKPWNLIPFIGWVCGGYDAKTKSLTVCLDEKGVVTRVWNGVGETDARYGFLAGTGKRDMPASATRQTKIEKEPVDIIREPGPAG